ncbi:MAG: RagB/SusD family nutrient uptake outer membrane protein [Bacteroidota bacterium]
MRKILIVILTLFIIACDDWLDIKPKNYVASDEVFATRENIYAALTGCYDALQLQHYYGRSFIIAGDLLSDNSVAKGTKIELIALDENALTPDNIVVEGIWEDIYTAVNRANYILAGIQKVSFLNESQKNDIVGQLLFLRALHYFNLVRLYGAVPLKLFPTIKNDPTNFLPRTPVFKVYEQILVDLDSAEVTIQNTHPQWATIRSVKALKALVYLTLNDYTNALLFANACLAENSTLESDYSKLFGSYTEPSSEIIFYIPFVPSDNSRLAEYHFPNQLGGRYENAPSSYLMNLIGTGDKREKWIAETLSTSSGTIFYAKKYPNLSTGANNVAVIRNAEVYFIRAEALYFSDSISNFSAILNDINTIRQRAGLNPVDSASVSGKLWTTLENEKQLEFAFEGKRWFDLIRTNRALLKISTVTTVNQTLFPIPQSEILYNPNIKPTDQNPGY